MWDVCVVGILGIASSQLSSLALQMLCSDDKCKQVLQVTSASDVIYSHHKCYKWQVLQMLCSHDKC